jgi:ferredoxin-type protein NapG
VDRRDFFKNSLNKAAETAVEHVDKVAKQKVNWFRPPYALPELDFLLACTRCGECVKACLEDALFLLSGKQGVQALNTPALDLNSQCCLLCDDWPCLQACEPKALQKPDERQPLEKLEPIATAHINTDACIPYSGMECGACNISCPIDGALFWVKTRPFIDLNKCVGCGQCRQACIFDPKAIDMKLIQFNE